MRLGIFIGLLGIVVALVGGVDAFAIPNNTVSTGRYTLVETSVTSAQIDPLDALMTVTIPADVSTVSQAMQYILQRSGWRLMDASASDEETKILYELPLPTVQRRLGPLTLRDALGTLAGKTYVVIEDPVHRLIGFSYAIKPNETPKRVRSRPSPTRR